MTLKFIGLVLVVSEPFVQSRHINFWRLAVIFLVSIAIPLLIGLGLDILYPSPVSMLTWAAIASIPIAAFTVSWAVLGEMKRVIDLVAPAQDTELTDAVKRSE